MSSCAEESRIARVKIDPRCTTFRVLPDGTYIFVNDADGTAHLENPQTGEKLVGFQTGGKPIDSIVSCLVDVPSMSTYREQLRRKGYAVL